MNVPKTALATAYGLRGSSGAKQIKEGQYTTIIYTLIKEKNYEEAVKILQQELQKFPKNRAALSLSAFAYYHMEDYASAAQFYEQLTKHYPDVDDYKLYHAQSLYKATQHVEAYKVCLTIDNPAYRDKVLKLQAAIKYEQDEMQATKSLIDECDPADADTILNQGCLAFKEGKYKEAEELFKEGMNQSGYQPEIAYFIALCHYVQRQYQTCMTFVNDIIEKGVREHPELSVISVNQGLDVRSVGNTQLLHETALIQAFNLKAAVDYQRKDYDAARDSLKCMPPRDEEELDAVTLHNIALMNMESNPQDGFEKLRFLISNQPCPPEALSNILLLYCKFQFYDLAAEVLIENEDLPYKFPELCEYLDATILQQTAPEEAYRKFDLLTTRHVDTLRRLIKNLQEALNRENDHLTRALMEYNDALEAYLPVLMAQARIYWDRENYSRVEKILFQSVEFFYLDLEDNPRIEKILRQLGDTAFDSEVWKLNLAHVFFMQNTKFPEAIKYYDPIVRKHGDNLLDNVAAIVLANLCVSYIMTVQNEEAEELMRRIEKEEERVAYDEPERQTYHSCIVNLVIGTLYCAKGHYEFGISRVIRSFEPISKKLNADTWFYAKRCLMALVETVAKHQTTLKDATFQEIVTFLEQAELHGKKVPTVISFVPEHPVDAAKNNVAYEARQIKHGVMRLRDL